MWLGVVIIFTAFNSSCHSLLGTSNSLKERVKEQERETSELESVGGELKTKKDGCVMITPATIIKNK